MLFFNSLARFILIAGWITFYSPFASGKSKNQLQMLDTKPWLPVAKQLSDHLDKFSSAAHSKGWSCLNLEHTLTQLDQAYQHLPLMSAFLALEKSDSHKELMLDFQKALKLCSHRHKGLALYEQVSRYRMLTLITKNEQTAFLTLYLNRFHPHTPKHIPEHKTLNQDLRRLPVQLKSLESYRLATDLVHGVLNPEKLFKIRKYFSPLFYDLLESQVWKINSNYNYSLRILMKISPNWLENSKFKKHVSKKLKPFELTHIKNRRPYFIRSRNWLIKRLEWLSKRIGNTETSASVNKLLKPFRKTKLSLNSKLDHRWKEVRTLWNKNETPTAISKAKTYVEWIKGFSTHTLKKKKVKQALSHAYIGLARMNLEINQSDQTFVFFEKAKPFCVSRHATCFLSYHRELALAYIMTGDYDKAFKALSDLTHNGKLDAYEIQSYQFWMWVLARHLKKKFTPEFPYLSYYRLSASCLSQQTITHHIPPKKLQYAPLSRHDISKFLKRKQSWFIHRTLQNKEESNAVNYYLRLMTYQIMGRLKKGRSAKLSLPKLMTFVKMLQDRKLYIESIGILFELSKRTPAKDLPYTFYTHFFPKYFQRDIVSTSKILNLPPALVSAFIRRESIFDPTALSPAYAMGLMQILPSTAQRVATSNGIPYQYATGGVVGLFQTESNIQIGSQYIKDLLKYFSGNLVYTMASYNAGEHRVDAWRERFEALEDSPLLFIENIPFNETRFYVKWVLFHYLYYETLYGHAQAATKTFCNYNKNPLPTKPTRIAKQ